MSTHRYRIVYGEHDDLRFVGHLDLARAWERTFRRADLALAYSAGYNPRPRINFGLALPLGCTSQADLADVWLAEPIEPGQLAQRLQAAAPPGLHIVQAQALAEHGPKLQALIQAAEFEVPTPAASRQGLEDRIAAMLSAGELQRERRGKAYDLRPLIQDLEMREDGKLWMQLTAGPAGVGRADEVLRALELAAEEFTPHRTRLILREE